MSSLGGIFKLRSLGSSVNGVKVWTTDGYRYHASLGDKVWQCPAKVLHLHPQQYIDWVETQDGMPREVAEALWRYANPPPVYETVTAKPAQQVIRGCWADLASSLHLTVPQVQALFPDLKDSDIDDINKRLEWLDCDRV